MRKIEHLLHIYSGSKKKAPYSIDAFILKEKTYSTRVIIPLSVLENTAANGVNPSLSATSRDDGECSERKQSIKNNVTSMVRL